MINYVKRAFEIDDESKALALECYKNSVTHLADKKFMWFGNCAFTKLREIFLCQWMMKKYDSRYEGDMIEFNKETVDAFNYANFNLGQHGEFINTAKELVAADRRVSDERLRELSDSMMFLAVFARQAA